MNPKFESIARKQVPEMDAILGKPFKVLDDGFVRVVDYMGNDAAIVQAARVSYGEGTTKMRQDRTLIRYLLRHRHTSPFEMCEIKLHIRVPMDCWRQWIRHRTANVNEYSTRYSVAIDSAQTTPPDGWRLQAVSNRQGSEGFAGIDQGNMLTQEEHDLHDQMRKSYNYRIESGIAREQARKDLPLSTYTEAYWKIDLHNLLHFLELRMEKHAQIEIREYARTIGEKILALWVPATWEAFLDYSMNGITLSVLEQKLIKALVDGGSDAAMKTAEEFGWLKRDNAGRLNLHYERMEFEEKIEHMGLSLPWH